MDRNDGSFINSHRSYSLIYKKLQRFVSVHHLKGLYSTIINYFMYTDIINFLNTSFDMASNPATSLWVIGSGASALIKQPHVKTPFLKAQFPYIESLDLTEFQIPMAYLTFGVINVVRSD